MNMKLYQKLKEKNLVEDFKEFNELIWMRSIEVEGKLIDNPNYEIKETEKDIKIGILSINV
jgi:predicted rRNA methylase YqxC with S4 and FtsJ domains